MRASRRIAALVIAPSLGTALFVGGPAPAAAPAESAPQTDATPNELEVWQAGIDDYKDRLMLLADDYDNYSGAALDPESQTLVIMGTGQPDEAVAAVIAEAPPEVKVSWETVAYSKAELERAGDEIASGPGIWITEYAADYSSITVVYHPDISEAADRQDRVDGIPIEWVPSDEPVAVPTAGRGAGEAPFHGGSRIIRPNNRICSTAVKAERDGGNEVMLTAHHCNSEDDRPNTSGGVEGIPWSLAVDGENVGKSGGLKSRVWDVQAIDNQTYTRDIWMGGVGSDAVRKTVTVGSGPVGNGDLVRASGGWSGDNLTEVHAPDADNIRYCLDNSNPFCDRHDNYVGVHDYAENGTAIWGGGDSGGPAVQYASGSSSNLKFAGVLVASQADTQAPCTGIQGGRGCYSRGWYSPWEEFKGPMNLTLPG